MTSTRVFSSYVITDPCIDVKDGTCVEVCPVDCIETTPEANQYFVDPSLCIACEQCVLVCPVDAFFLEHEVPEQWKASIERNANFFLQAQEALPSVSQAEAQVLIDGAQARATELGIAVSIAVVDKRGELVAFGGDGQAAAETEQAARSKAYSAAVMEIATSLLTESYMAGAPPSVDRGRIVLEAGGIPFGRPHILGAVGVAGGTPEQDHDCGRAAVTPRQPA